MEPKYYDLLERIYFKDEDRFENKFITNLHLYVEDIDTLQRLLDQNLITFSIKNRYKELYKEKFIDVYVVKAKCTWRGSQLVYGVSASGAI